MVNLENYSSELVEKDGLYFAKEVAEISYPEKGNEDCFILEDNSFWFKHRNDCIIEAVQKYAGKRVFFDIGGGNGFVSRGLAESGIETVLVEPGISGCLNARKRGLQNIVCSTLQNASFKIGSIPAIGLFDVVEHIEDDRDFLTSIRTFLMDDGLVFMTVPAYQSLWSDEDDDAGHFRRYSLTEIENRLIQTGFKIEYSTYIFSILPLPVFLLRSLPSRLGLYKNVDDMSARKAEHEGKTGVVDKVLKRIWSLELNKIRVGGKIPAGGSCFIVARKVA